MCKAVCVQYSILSVRSWSGSSGTNLLYISGCNHVIHINDYFLFWSTSLRERKQSLDKFLLCCRRTRVPKSTTTTTTTIGPNQCLMFARIELNTVALEARLLEDKITTCIYLIRKLLRHALLHCTHKNSRFARSVWWADCSVACIHTEHNWLLLNKSSCLEKKAVCLFCSHVHYVEWHFIK